MKVIYLYIIKFLLSLTIVLHNGDRQHVAFSLLYTSLFFKTVKRTEDKTKKREQRYFAVFFSLAILLSASKTPIYDYNTRTTTANNPYKKSSFSRIWELRNNLKW